MLVAERGGFKPAALFFPFLSRNQVLVIGILFAALSATMVPAAWKPKQDYAAAADFIAQHRLPGDGAACIGQIHLPLAA